MRTGEVRYLLNDAFYRMAYTAWVDPASPPVVCVHGLTRAAERFVDRATQNLLRAFAAGPAGRSHPARDNLAQVKPPRITALNKVDTLPDPSNVDTTLFPNAVPVSALTGYNRLADHYDFDIDSPRIDGAVDCGDVPGDPADAQGNRDAITATVRGAKMGSSGCPSECSTSFARSCDCLRLLGLVTLELME